MKFFLGSMILDNLIADAELCRCDIGDLGFSHRAATKYHAARLHQIDVVRERGDKPQVLLDQQDSITFTLQGLQHGQHATGRDEGRQRLRHGEEPARDRDGP